MVDVVLFVTRYPLSQYICLCQGKLIARQMRVRMMMRR
jgi:hypothetical protein